MAEEKRLSAARNANESVKAGLKAAAVAGVAAAIPTVLAVRFVPWARSNLNYAGQALIVSLAAGAAYFIVADQKTLEHARSSYSQRLSTQKEEQA